MVGEYFNRGAILTAPFSSGDENPKPLMDLGNTEPLRLLIPSLKLDSKSTTIISSLSFPSLEVPCLTTPTFELSFSTTPPSLSEVNVDWLSIICSCVLIISCICCNDFNVSIISGLRSLPADPPGTRRGLSGCRGDALEDTGSGGGLIITGPLEGEVLGEEFSLFGGGVRCWGDLMGVEMGLIPVL